MAKQKKGEKKEVVQINYEPANETHMEIFRRLSNPKFNSGWMHGTPGKRKGEQ